MEDLQVERDVKSLDDVSAEHWQDFVRDLLPPGVSSLFFFDGERIQQLAEDSSDEQTLADAIKSLLGLDVVERLQTDLGIYLARLIKPLGRGSEHSDEVTSIQEDITAVEASIEDCRRQREAQQERLRELKSAIQRFAAAGQDRCRSGGACSWPIPLDLNTPIGTGPGLRRTVVVE